MRVALFALLLTTGCGERAGTPDAGTPDAGTPQDAGDDARVYREWQRIELPGTVCGDDSQYKFFVNWFPDASGTMLYMESGGACWDYETCSMGAAAHPDGVPDDLIDLWENGSPLLRRSRSESPVARWNLIFLPYCTGDVHAGDRDVIYEDPAGVGEPLPYRHRGHANLALIAEWLHGEEPEIDRLLVSGFSAGGAGAVLNYAMLRDTLRPARSYLLDDSGPLFPAGGNSDQVQATITDAWGVDDVIARSLPEAAARVAADLGEINAVLAERYPDDRIGLAFFQLDYNYSVYSYARFFDDPPREEIYRMWFEDTADIVTLYDRHDNLAYFLPFWRELNDSHGLTFGAWSGTEIEEAELDMLGFTTLVLDDEAPLTSVLETAREGPYADLAP